MGVGSDAQGVTWSHPDALPEVVLYPGVTKKTLWSEVSGRKALLITIAPGCRFLELDVHEPGPEEVYVVEGVFQDGVRDYPAGSYIHNPKGSSHMPQSRTGCILLVFFPEG